MQLRNESNTKIGHMQRNGEIILLQGYVRCTRVHISCDARM